MRAQLLNGHDCRSAARRRLPRGLFEYIDRGAEDETALRAISDDLAALRFYPRVLAGHTEPDLSTDLFGCARPTPLIIAPTAMAGLVTHDGEIKLARAAARNGIPFTISTQSMSSVEQIRAAAPKAELWFQLYLWQDRRLSDALVDRALASGIRTLVVTADTAASPNREFNQRNGFGMPFRWTARAAFDVVCHPGWIWRLLLPSLMRGGMPAFAHYPTEARPTIVHAVADRRVLIDQTIDWADLRSIRKRWPGKLLIKGVLHPHDAIRAADEGMDGVVVSSHGGRNLDCAVTTAHALPAIAEAVGSRMAVLADSGVRRGSDVLKYLALGANAVLMGRLPLWGLAAGDEPGADHVLGLILAEIRTSMLLLGIERPIEARSQLNGPFLGDQSL